MVTAAVNSAADMLKEKSGENDIIRVMSNNMEERMKDFSDRGHTILVQR